MARRKAIVVVVEGRSDEEALAYFFESYFDSTKVFVKVMGGDITSDYKVPQSQLVRTLENKIRQKLAVYNVKPADLVQVIHLVDMDGAYIPDSCIQEKDGVSKTFYTLTTIETDKKEKIEKRNAWKRASVNLLSSKDTIFRSVPYHVYYMSCNLDHVLHDNPNLTPAGKMQKAVEFAMRHEGSDGTARFIEFISTSSFAVSLPYRESWEMIQQGCRSLERHTNLGLCFKENA